MNDFKKKMKEKINTYSDKQYLEGYIKEEFLTHDGDADLYLTLNNIDELIDTRTSGDQLDICSDIYEFIETKSDMLDNDTLLELHIKGIEVDSKIQGKVKHIIKEHYAIELYKTQRRFNRCRNKIIGLVFLGIITLLIYTLIYLNSNSDFALEIFGFLFTFALWEAFDAFLYDLSDIKFERENITQNLLMKVCFDENNDEKSSSEEVI